jgi:hypothetical protein
MAEIQDDIKAAGFDLEPDTSDVTWPDRSRSAQAAESRARAASWVMRLFGIVAGCWMLAIGLQIAVGPCMTAPPKFPAHGYDRASVPADWRYP